ncbi:LuxR C-terminal-related transcriptional regulator [Amycolatopsis sp. cmx-11-12]
MARLLGISVTTVRRHVKAIYEKFGVGNRFAAGVAAAVTSRAHRPASAAR